MQSPPFPPGKYKVILADPPWTFKTWSDKATRSAKRHYPVMKVEDICALPVADLAEPGTALFLWGTSPNLLDMLKVMEAWGFRYTTKAFCWAKRTRRDRAWHQGNGYYTRANSEDCWLGLRVDRYTRSGKPVVTVPKRKSRSIRQLVVAPLGSRHSEKPVTVHERIEELFDGPYIELFARGKPRPGWTGWGLECEGDDAATDCHIGAHEVG